MDNEPNATQATNFTTEWGAQWPGQQRQDLPHIIKLLKDPDQQVRMNATNGLLELDR